MLFPTLSCNMNYSNTTNWPLSNYEQRQLTLPPWQMKHIKILCYNKSLPSFRNNNPSSVNKLSNTSHSTNHRTMPSIWNPMLLWRNVAFIASLLPKPLSWKNTLTTTSVKDTYSMPIQVTYCQPLFLCCQEGLWTQTYSRLLCFKRHHC